MALRDLLNIFRRTPDQQYARGGEIRGNNTQTEPVNDFGGSRTTIPKFTQGGGSAFGALPKRTQRDLGLDERTLGSYSVEDLIDRMMDAHPDLSYAVWNFLRIGNSGYSIEVFKLGNGKQWEQGEREVNEFLETLSYPNPLQFEKSRAIKKVINQLLLSIVTRGAAALELVLTPDRNDVAFLAPVDPATIAFKFENDRFIPYQDQEKLALDIPTFFYEGLDERIDDPYGRNPLLSSISMIMFQLQILNDVKAVVHNQGYPRFDIKIIEEVLLARMPIAIRNNELEKQKWLNARLKEIIDMYNNLEPDDTFVHYDSVEIDTVGGGKGGGAMIDPEKLMNAIDNLIMTGLKTLSTILGRRSNGNTESFAKIEIKLYLQGVKAMQEVAEDILGRALTLFLNIRGKQGIVKFKFKPLEIRTELEQEQFEQIRLQNIAYKRDQGWIDQDEAAQIAVGHDAVGEPVSNQPQDGEVKGNPDEKGAGSPTETPEGG